MNVCILFMLVFVYRHISEPYIKTDFTLELKLKSRSFVFVVICWVFQMLFRAMKAPHAFPMRVLMSASDPPCSLMTLPKYVKVSTSGRFV